MRHKLITFVAALALAAFVVLSYITLGGLSAAIYNEVLQFFVIIAGLLPITIIGLVKVGGIDGLFDKVRQGPLGEAGLHTWSTTGGTENPLGASWIGIVFGLGFVLSFGYWTTAKPGPQLTPRALAALLPKNPRQVPSVA